MRPTRAPSIHRVALAPRLGARLALRPPRAAPREDNDQPVDIDALAAALAAAAGARRAAGESVDAEEEEGVASGDEPSPPPRASTPFDVASASTRAAEVFAEHPDTGFDPDTIELLQELGRVSWSEDGGEAGPTVAAVAYAARYTPAAPFQSPTLVLVKEYAPSATSLAANEVQVGVRLSAGSRLPGRKWHAATGRGTPAPRPPAVPLLGYFQAAPAAVLDGSDDSDGDDDSAAATWLVFKWEGLQPLSFYAAADQPPPAGLAALLPRDTTASDRTRMLRAVLAGAAAALARVHAAGVAHGSLGGGCVLLSSYTDAEWRRVTVTLDNFGFAQMRRGGGEDGGRGVDDDPVALAQAADARALARLAVETLLAALGERGAGDPTIRPLAKDVVRAAEEGGGTAARAVVAGAPAFARAAAALDADDGWGVVAALAHGARLSEVVASEWVVRADGGPMLQLAARRATLGASALRARAGQALSTAAPSPPPDGDAAAPSALDALLSSLATAPPTATARRAVLADPHTLTDFFRDMVRALRSRAAVALTRAHVETEFEEFAFLEGAKDAYYMVHSAVSDGDWKAARGAVAPSLLAGLRGVRDAYTRAVLAFSLAVDTSAPLTATIDDMALLTPALAAEIASGTADAAAAASTPPQPPSGGPATPALAGMHQVLAVRFYPSSVNVAVRNAEGAIVSELVDRRPKTWRFVRGPLPGELPHMNPAEAAAALAAFKARVDPRDAAQAELLAAIRAATSSLTSTTPAWRLSNPLPAAGAPPPGAQDALDAYIRHVAAEAADGRADEVALAVLDEGERGGGEPAWREGEEGGVRALPGAG